ncbi:hypothetical protein BJ165DRAFT_1474926 [Panaeolus papilionaceus]|nr:hypothetical protein BJ165DRAFT_1474926 [Panaeolus papilionaceus]
MSNTDQRNFVGHDLLVAVPTDGPVITRFLQNCHVLSCVIEYFKPTANDSSDEIKDARKTLLNIALVCQALAEASFDGLWRVIPGFRPLLSILAPLIRIMNEPALVFGNSVLDWQRFDFYARRVRVYCPRGKKVPISSNVYIHVLRSRTSPLFPGLLTISFHTMSAIEPQEAFILPSPSIQYIEVHNSVTARPKFWIPFFSALSVGAPNLKHLILNGDQPISLEPISNFRHLQEAEIQLPGTYINSDFLQVLGGMAELRSLTLDTSALSPTVAPFQILSQATQELPAPIAPLPPKFMCLTKLTLEGPPQSIYRILQEFPCQNILQLRLIEHKASTTDAALHGTWPLIIQKICSASKLDNFSIGSRLTPDSGCSLTVPILMPCTSFTCLTSLSISHIAVNISDNDLVPFLSPLKSLKTLFLRLEMPGGGLSFGSLHQISCSCPSIHSLFISIAHSKERNMDAIKNIGLTQRQGCGLVLLVMHVHFFDAGPIEASSLVEISKFLNFCFPKLKCIRSISPEGAFGRGEQIKALEIFTLALQEASALHPS